MEKIPKHKKLNRYPGYGFLESGKIINLITGRILQGFKCSDGYYRTRLSIMGMRKTQKVSRLMAEAWLDNPHSLPCINHKDFNKANDRPDNLEWCTQKENIDASATEGRIGKGGSIYINQLNPKTKELIKTWESSAAAGKELKISYKNILACAKGKRKSAGGYIWEIN